MAGLADDQQRLPGEHVPVRSQPLKEGGVLQGGLLQGRVRQGRGGLAQPGHGGGQVGPPGPDQDLHGAGEAVQPPAVGGGQRVLLFRAAQREVHRADRRDGGGSGAAQADHPVGRYVLPQRREHRRGRGRRAGHGGPGGRAGDAFGGGDQAARGAPLPPGGHQEPVQRQAVPLPDDQGHGGQADG